jgi:hypothetical protein
MVIHPTLLVTSALVSYCHYVVNPTDTSIFWTACLSFLLLRHEPTCMFSRTLYIFSW